ncbi:MAG: NAD(P)/FAD-dependent oxidoreductase [Lachnospiraceae bacterium]
MKTDVLIIGGGVIGCAVAYELAKYKIDVVVLEKDGDIANGTSKANSGIAHNGFGEKATTIRGKYCVRGSKMLKDLCEQLHVPYIHRIGAVGVGFDEADLKKMEYAKKNAEQLGIDDVQILSGDAIFELEPNLSRDVKYAIFNPGLSIIGSYELNIAFGESAARNGVRFLLNHEVLSIDTKDRKVTSVHTNHGDFEAKVVINAAGLYADKIASMVEEIDFAIRPRKGEYFLYDKKVRTKLNHIVGDLGSEYSKAMIVAPTVHGNVLAGSSAAFIEEKDDYGTTGEKLDMIYDTLISKALPSIPRFGDVITTFAGNRAASSTEDFIIEFAKTVDGFINLAGMQSPALTSSPAIAEDVVEMVKEAGLTLEKKEEYLPFREKPVVISELEPDEINKLIKERPDYGDIICRCETISRGEIIDAIRSPIPAVTVDAIKRRTRAGMGRCQGGFCGPRVLAIVAEELGVDLTEINKSNSGSYMVSGKTKEMQEC